MILGQEPLGLRRQGFSPCLSLLTSAFSLPWCPRSLTLPLHSPWNAPLPDIINDESAASVPYLAPLYLRRETTRSVSCYAFFEGWLLLSQPPDCLGSLTSLTTQYGFGDLSRQSGLFPSRLRNLSPAVSLPDATHRDSEFDRGW